MNAPAFPLSLVWAATVATLGAIITWAWGWSGGLPYDNTSGVWIALADDLAHGNFYRPIHSELGFGGTRYVPVFFALLAGLMKLGLTPPTAGAVLTFSSLLALGFGAGQLMRLLGASNRLAIICVCLVPASIALQLLGLATKGDLMASALSVWGAIAVLRWKSSPRIGYATLAIAAFTAALLTKFTAGFACAAVVLWALRERRFVPAIILTLGVSLLTSGLLVAFNTASDGRMFEVFAACATGGLDLAYAMRAPWWFLRVAGQDPFFLTLFFAGVAAALRRGRRGGLDWLLVYFITTAVGTAALFVTPGADSNHLIDLLIASVVVLAVELTQGGSPRTTSKIAFAFTVAIAATWIPGVPSVAHLLARSGRPTLDGVAAMARSSPALLQGPILAENPLLPILLDQRPSVLDPFNLRLVTQDSAKLRATFKADLTSRHYAAVVLTNWSGVSLEDMPAQLVAHSSVGVDQFYGEVHFPANFLETLHAHYRITQIVHPFVVFEPRTE